MLNSRVLTTIALAAALAAPVIPALAQTAPPKPAPKAAAQPAPKAPAKAAPKTGTPAAGRYSRSVYSWSMRVVEKRQSVEAIERRALSSQRRGSPLESRS